ncbi:MAG: putative baseplate assembly protein [Sulfurifustaceae bacterium]
MKCDPRPPLIVARNARAIAEALDANRRGYTPEWRAPRGSADAGMALNDILARYLEIQGDGLNAMPQRLQLEFLESLGANVLPAQPARAPLVFKLLDTASDDATVPKGTRVAAVLPPPAPSLESDTASTPRAPAPEFFTEQEITAMRGTLAALYSIDPQADTYTDHTAAAGTGFAIYDDARAVPHRLYLGHGELFKLTGSAQIVLTFDFAPVRPDGAAVRGQRPLLLDWEYLSVDGWQPLKLIEDGTQRFTTDGKITLEKFYGPDSKEDTVNGLKSCWIRATVSDRIPAARIRADGATVNAQGYYVVQVESGIELHAGDRVTVDGNTITEVAGVTDTTLLLKASIDRLVTSEYITLADALPPVRPDGADQEGALPQVDVIRARVGLEKTDLPLDAAYLDSFKIDISKDFHPFGEQPEKFAAFYIACKDAFGRIGARITLNFTFTLLYDEYKNHTATPPKLQAEYFDGSRWLALGSAEDYVDNTASLTKGDAPGSVNGTISFIRPAAWVESEVSADKQLWLRLRIVDGDYGKPLSLSITADPNDNTKYIVNSVPSTLKPPIVARIGVSYLYFTNPHPLDYCVTENEFAFTERSEDARWARSPFAPFTPVSDRTPAVHFGFSSKPPAALVSLLVQVIAPAEEGDVQPYAWDYWGSRGWTELSVRDATLGFNRTGLVQFVGAPDALPREGLGGALYRIRARLKTGLQSGDQIARLGGVWLNAAWARQGNRVERDGLGISNGNPDQSYALPVVRAAKPVPGSGETATALNAAEFERALDTPLAGVPILGDELVEVREWSGRGDDWQTLLGDVDPADIRFEVDPQEPTVKTAAWVRWKPQLHFYYSGPNDRHYVVERARGVFRFPGPGGFIPPAGAPIVASYVTGGGTDGNVPAGAVRELRSGIGFVQSVTNPIAASGGAGAELLRGARDRSGQRVRHRDRAVSVEDYEWLAQEASSEVARVRALPLEGPAGRGSRGFVGIVIVPHSLDAMPQPSPELCRNVIAALARRAPAGIAGGIRIVEPSYVPVGVHAEVLPRRAEEAGRVEARVRLRLASFLHPLTGGAAARGWDFGESVYLSDLAALIEDTEGVDAVRFLQLMVGQSVYGDSVPVEPHQLIAAGDSQLKIIVPSLPYALA